MLGAVLAYPRARTRNAWRGKPDDGLAMAAYWLAASNGSVTLDYEGRLFLSLWRLRAGSVGLGLPAPEPIPHPDQRLAPTRTPTRTPDPCNRVVSQQYRSVQVCWAAFSQP